MEEEKSMSETTIVVDGDEYPLAPMEPELHDRPTPQYIMVITPAIAKSWLKYNYRNRNQREGGKRDYSNDMREGNYDINGSSITFTRPLGEGEDELVPTGKPMLVDGQHRLESCILANAPFPVYVAFGLKPTARRTVDTGIKRTFADVLSMDGETNSLTLASVVKRAHAWSTGDRHLLLKKSGTTHSQGQEFLAKHPELRRSAEVATHVQALFHMSTQFNSRQSVVGLAHWLFMQHDPTKAPEFFQRVGDGVLDTFDHPINVLRRRLIKDLRDPVQQRGDSRRVIPKVPDWQMLCYFIRTWNIYLRGPLPSGDWGVFAPLGAKDQDKMPRIWTSADADKALDRMLVRLDAQEKGIADPAEANEDDDAAEAA